MTRTWGRGSEFSWNAQVLDLGEGGGFQLMSIDLGRLHSYQDLQFEPLLLLQLLLLVKVTCTRKPHKVYGATSIQQIKSMITGQKLGKLNLLLTHQF